MEDQIRKLLVAFSGFGSQKMEDIGFISFLFVLLVSLMCSIFIAFLYIHFFSRRSTGSQVHRAFPLLGISVTSIFICIQFSLPLSLGLLGALSIVRFRTPIKEPEEIGFIMLIIASSIACATFNFTFLGILLAAAIGASFVIYRGPHLLRSSMHDGILIITLTQYEYSSKYDDLMKCLDTMFVKGRIESISKNGNDSVISYHFSQLKKHSLKEVQSQLNVLIEDSSYNIFFNQPGDYGN